MSDEKSGIREVTKSLPGLEKSGKLLLLESDMKAFKEGTLSQRLQELDVSWAELQEAVKSNNYELIQG